MRAHEAQNSFRVPLALGRTASDLVVRDQYGEQLDIFRDTLDPASRVQIMAMMALSDPKHFDEEQHARIADIAEVMGYERNQRGVFDPKLYQRIEECGMMLFRKEVPLFVRNPAKKKTASGQSVKYSGQLVFTRLLQEFGFLYKDDDGTVINPEQHPERIEYKDDKGRSPVYAIPVVDDQNCVVFSDSGQPRRRKASGVTWRWASRIADLNADSTTSWIFYSDAVEILRKYLKDKTTFELIWLTLFWKGQGYIEISFDKLVQHLGIQSKDRKQVRAAVNRAFQAALEDGIIDALPTFDPAGKWVRGQKKPRRTSETVRWRRARRWTVGSALAIAPAESVDQPFADQTDDKDA